MKLKKSDIVLIGVVGILLIIILIMSDRYYKITGYYGNRFKNGDECVEIRLKNYSKGDSEEVVYTEKEDSEKCINALNKLKLRKRDFIDDINDSIQGKTCGWFEPVGWCEMKHIAFEYDDGRSVVMDFYLDYDKDISDEIEYDGKEYFTKGKAPQELWDLFYDE